MYGEWVNDDDDEAVKLAVRREESLCRQTHRPMLEVREIWQEDPGASRKSLLKRAKAQVTVSDADKRLHIKCEDLLFAPPFDITFNKYHVITHESRK